MLQVLYHTMANLVHVQDVEEVNIAQQLKSLTVQTADLVVILLEYFGKLSQPRRDLYEKVTGLQPTPVEQANGFLTQLEQDSAMEEARRRDLIYQHVSVIAPSNRGGGKHNRGNRGGNRRGGRGQARGNLRHLSSVPTSRQQDATPAATTSAEKTASPAKPTSTSPPGKGTPKGGGRGNKDGRGNKA